MSNGFGLLVAAAFVLPVPAAGQDAGPLTARLRRLDSLRQAAQAALLHADSVRRERLDTIRAGALMVMARPADAALVVSAAAPAWTRLDSLYGDEAIELRSAPLLFVATGRPLPRNERAHLQIVMAPQNATAQDVSFDLVRAASVALLARRDQPLVDWLGSQLLPDVATAQERARVYVELVTAPSQAVRDCYSGRLDRCADALGIGTADPLSAWYDAAERRELVRREGVARGGSVARAKACLQQQSDDACLAVLRDTWLEPPLGSEARQSLLRIALASGGRRAFVRLADGMGNPLRDRLALAAALPLDTLLRRWRGAILAARPHPVPIAAAGGWTALAWSIVFGLVALRSTRWR